MYILAGLAIIGFCMFVKIARHIYILSLVYVIIFLKIMGITMLYSYLLIIRQYFDIMQQIEDNETSVSDFTVLKQIFIVMWTIMNIIHEVIFTIFSIFNYQQPQMLLQAMLIRNDAINLGSPEG